MFDAYTVKKVLPRLVIAVILIQLSWFIFTGMLALTNSIAYGIEALIYAPFGGPDEFTLAALLSGVDSAATGAFTTAAIGVAAVAFAGGVIPVLFILLMAIVVAIFALTLRRMLLILLLLLAPIALVAWILPNTERFWKMWWDNYTKLLLMYPIILIMIAAGRVFSKVASNDDGSDIINVAIILGGYFIPLLIIPKTFALAGAAFATLGGAINQAGQKGSATGAEKGKEKWGNTRWGLRKQGKKDAKLNTRRQQETAKGVSKAVSSKGLGGIIYRQGLGGKKGAGTAALEASADKALIDSQAEGFIHHGEEYTPDKLRDLAADKKQSMHSRQAALKALAMQGETGALIQASHLLHGQGAEGAKLYNDTLRQNYGTFAAAGAGTTHFLDAGTSLQQNAASQLAKYQGASHEEVASMGPRAMYGMIEANLVATRTAADPVGNTDATLARHQQVLDIVDDNPQVQAKLKMKDSAYVQTNSIDKWLAER